MDILNEEQVLKSISSSHFEHTLWVNELKFFEDEIGIYEHQLEKLVRTNQKSFLPALEQFQNNFIRHKEVLDQLNHDIKVHEQKLGWAVQNNHYNEDKFKKEHEEIREKIKTFKHIFTDLKGQFYRFLIAAQ